MMEKLFAWMKRSRSQGWEWGAAAFCYVGVFALVTRSLFLQMANVLEGDLWMQVHIAIDPPGSLYTWVPSYSLYRYIFRALHALWASDWVFVLFVLAVAVAGCLMTGAYLCRFTFCKNPALCVLLGMGLYCADPLFLPFLNPYRVMGMQAGGMWHNPTLLGIKLLGVLILWLYAELCKNFSRQISIGKLMLLALLFFLATFVKPSLSFAVFPALAVLLLAWLWQTRGKKFWQLAALACTIVPSLGIMLWQYLRTYQGADGESGIAFLFGYNIRLHTYCPAFSVLQSLAFPMAVLLVCWPELRQKGSYSLTWLASFFAYAEYLWLVETGPRMEHGNWNWGASVCAFLLFVVSLEQFMKVLPSAWKNGSTRRLWVLVCAGLLLWHVVCGVEFLFYYLIQGSYF